MAQIIAAPFWGRPVRALFLACALALGLAGCSMLRVAYQQAPTALYWWVDGYADLDDAQSTQVRQDIDRFMAWHRRSELPALISLLQQWQAMTQRDTSAEQSCAQYDAVRAALVRFVDRGHEPLARLLLQLSPDQLQHLQTHQIKANQSFERDFLRGSTEDRLERRLDRLTGHYETLYGSLSPQQLSLVREGLKASPFDAARTLGERRTRQSELLVLIRQQQGLHPGGLAPRSPVPRDTADAVRGWLLRGLPTLGTDSTQPGAPAPWLRQGCAAYAALHNSTSTEQRAHAVQVLKGYETDLRSLAGQD